MKVTTTRALAEHLERRLSALRAEAAATFDALDAVTSLRERLVAAGVDPDAPAGDAIDALTATDPDRAAFDALVARIPPERSNQHD